MTMSEVFLETVETINGKKRFRRLKTSFILSCGFLFIPIGLYLVLAWEIMFGGTLVVLLAPCFLLYPAIRFFLFGGKDSVAAVVTTVVVEEITKAKIKDVFKERHDKRK